MSDYTEMKTLAEHHRSLGHAYTVATPADVLALIAENERLSSMQSAFFENLEKLEGLKPFAPHELGKHLIDIAMDRIEALRKDAERYRWLRREGRKHVVDAAPTILNRETGMITIMRAALADEQIDSLMAEDHD